LSLARGALRHRRPVPGGKPQPVVAAAAVEQDAKQTKGCERPTMTRAYAAWPCSHSIWDKHQLFPRKFSLHIFGFSKFLGKHEFFGTRRIMGGAFLKEAHRCHSETAKFIIQEFSRKIIMSLIKIKFKKCAFRRPICDLDLLLSSHINKFQFLKIL